MRRVCWLGVMLAMVISCHNKSNDTLGSAQDAVFEQIILNHGKRIEAADTSTINHLLDSAAQTFSLNNSAVNMQKYMYLCGYYKNQLHNGTKAMQYADSMIKLVETTTDVQLKKEHAATAYFSKGDAYFELKNYEQAYRYFFKGKKIAKENLDDCHLNDYSYRLGMVMYNQECYATAASQFLQCLEEVRSCEASFYRFYRIQELYSNIALSYSKLKLYDSALVFFNKGLAYIEKNASAFDNTPNQSEVAKAVIWGNMGQIYLATGQYARAESLLLKSIHINAQKNNDVYDAQFARLTLAKLYLQQNNLVKALANLQAVENNLPKAGNSDIKTRLAEVKWQYYQATGNTNLAFANLRQHVHLKDSIALLNRDFKKLDIGEQLAYLEKEYEVDRLSRHNQNQKLVLAVAITFAVMATAIVVLVYKNAAHVKNNLSAQTLLNLQVNEQKHQLEATLQELEKQNTAKDKILHVVAHDLRTPLNGIMGLTAIILEDTPQEHPHYRMMELIQNTSAESLQLINEILEVAGFTDVNQLSTQPADMNLLLQNTIDLLRFKALEKNLDIVLELDDQVRQVEINREKISRVVSNLVSNAIKFSPPKGEIVVRSEQTNEGVEISVEDHGMGIPEALQDKVFNVFTQARRPGTQGEKSFGLGLSICNQIISAHDGKIWFKSVPGTGSTFHVMIKN